MLSNSFLLCVLFVLGASVSINIDTLQTSSTLTQSSGQGSTYGVIQDISTDSGYIGVNREIGTMHHIGPSDVGSKIDSSTLGRIDYSEDASNDGSLLVRYTFASVIDLTTGGQNNGFVTNLFDGGVQDFTASTFDRSLTITMKIFTDISCTGAMAVGDATFDGVANDAGDVLTILYENIFGTATATAVQCMELSYNSPNNGESFYVTFLESTFTVISSAGGDPHLVNLDGSTRDVVKPVSGERFLQLYCDDDMSVVVELTSLPDERLYISAGFVALADSAHSEYFSLESEFPLLFKVHDGPKVLIEKDRDAETEFLNIQIWSSNKQAHGAVGKGSFKSNWLAEVDASVC